MISNSIPNRVVIVGGGIMGLALAYHLSQRGAAVTVYEQSQILGGLASPLIVGDVRVDRFYHTILSSDLSLKALIEACGAAELLHFTPTKQGFYDKGKVYPFNTPFDFLRFPPLSLFERFRLGLQVIYAQSERDWRKMDCIPVEKWLTRVSGQNVYHKVWKPLLRAKFDSEAVNVPATYIWSRLRRMMGTREGVTSKEMMCYLEGGYYTLIEALAAQCERQGVTFHLKTPIQEILIRDNRVIGVRTPDGDAAADLVISTLPTPIFGRLIPGLPEPYRAELATQQYLGVLCLLLILKERLTPYYVINITDESVPFTAVVETTNLIDPQYVGGHHLVYLPKYLAPGSELATLPDEQVIALWMANFRRMFTDFDERQISQIIVQRERYVEPLRPLGTTHQIPSVKTPIEGLYLSNTTMVYPELNNGESVSRFAAKIAQLVLDDLRLPSPDLVASVEAI